MPKLIYKAHKVYDLYHETCGEFVTGNGSTIIPYKCSCGEWEWYCDAEDRFGDWRLKDESK